MTGLEYDVVIPTQGQRIEMLASTLASIDRQALPPQRIVIAVDGSTATLESIRSRFPSRQLIHVGPGAGPAGARSAGIRFCSSDWVCFVDDDDLWHREKMQMTADYLSAHPGCAAVRTTFWVFTEPTHEVLSLNSLTVDVVGSEAADLEQAASERTPSTAFDYLRIEGDSLGLLLERNRGVIGSTCVRRSIFSEIPSVPSDLRPGDDHVLFCLVATRTEWHLLDTPLLFYRLHAGQDTRRPDPSQARRIIRSRIVAWELCGEQAPRPLSTYGETYRREFRPALWALARSGELIEYLRTLREAARILPRWSDRVRIVVPEPLAWRWRHRWSPSARRDRRDRDALGRGPDRTAS